MWSWLQSLLFSPQCPLCQKSAPHVFCRDCQGQVLAEQCSPVYRQQRWRQSLIPQFIWGYYDGSLRRAITTMKYEQQPLIGEWLGERLAEQWLQHPEIHKLPPLQVVPIPLHSSKQKQRGFNQAESIAIGFCRLTRYPLGPQALLRQKKTEALFQLSPRERQQKLWQALSPGSQFNTRRPWLIVDDIFTTGATTQEACRVIQGHQGTVTAIAAIASPRNS